MICVFDLYIGDVLCHGQLTVLTVCMYELLFMYQFAGLECKVMIRPQHIELLDTLGPGILLCGARLQAIMLSCQC